MIFKFAKGVKSEYIVIEIAERKSEIARNRYILGKIGLVTDGESLGFFRKILSENSIVQNDIAIATNIPIMIISILRFI